MIKSVYISRIFISLLLVVVTPLIVVAQQKTTTEQKKPVKSAKTLYGTASYYSNKFEGRRTANGETFSQKKFTAACNALG
jgi:rare lipoprotein A